VKAFDSEVLETLQTTQVLRPKEPPIKATIPVLPMPSGHDHEATDEDFSKGSDKK
jgi:hypothetical protein